MYVHGYVQHQNTKWQMANCQLQNVVVTDCPIQILLGCQEVSDDVFIFGIFQHFGNLHLKIRHCYVAPLK
jgi:hypothetical protein